MKNKSDFDIIYQLTYLIEPPNLGMLVIEDLALSKNQYLALKSKLQTPNNIKPIEYGDTQNKGVVFSTYLSSPVLFNDYIDAFLALANDVVNLGMDKEDGKPPVPRLDLKPCLDNSKVYILNDKIKQPKVLSKYFEPNEIIYPSTQKLKGKLGNIVRANQSNLKDSEEDFSMGFTNE